MFWGLIMEPNKRYTQTVEKSFHVSQAALDVSTGTEADCQVMVVVEQKNFLVCTLRKNNVIQVPLDLYFKTGDFISFMTNGKCNIHLTGYLDPEFGDSDLDSLGEEEDEEEEVPTKEKKKKRKLETSIEESTSKKQKKQKAQAKEESSEEDSDESSGDEQLRRLLGADDVDSDDNDHSFKLNSTNGSSTADDSDVSDDDSEGEEDQEDDDDDDDEEEEEKEEVIEEPKLSKTQLKKLKKQQKQENNAKPQQNGDVKKNKEAKPTKEVKKEKSAEKEKAVAVKNKQLSGGVMVEDVKVGQGELATSGKLVQVYYDGRLKSNNKRFDSCTKGPGFKFRLGSKEVISGWDVGVAGMRVGGKRKIVCPPAMAYGSSGSPPVIPPNATLVFEVELKSCK